MPFVDLHLHTSHSDGSDPPAKVVQRAAALRIAAIAIVDHDALSAIPEARDAAQELGIEFIEGTEVSAQFGQQEVHILGLGIDPACVSLAEGLRALREARCTRAEKVMGRLRELGIEMDYAKVRAQTGDGVVSRMHIARELRAMGVIKSTQEGFDRFLNGGRPAFVPKTRMPADEAIEVIHAAGGLAFLAHPGLSKSTRKALPQLVELPFDGIEAYHISHSPGRTEEFLGLARERNLLVSGGSDCHGTMKKSPEMGKVRTPYTYFAEIRKALGRG